MPGPTSWIVRAKRDYEDEIWWRIRRYRRRRLRRRAGALLIAAVVLALGLLAVLVR